MQLHCGNNQELIVAVETNKYFLQNFYKMLGNVKKTFPLLTYKWVLDCAEPTADDALDA